MRCDERLLRIAEGKSLHRQLDKYARPVKGIYYIDNSVAIDMHSKIIHYILYVVDICFILHVKYACPINGNHYIDISINKFVQRKVTTTFMVK